MNNRELIKAVAENSRVDEEKALQLLIVFENIVSKTLADGGEVTLFSIGKFHCKKQRARIGRDAQSGEPIAISSRAVPTFTPSQRFKDAIQTPV